MRRRLRSPLLAALLMSGVVFVAVHGLRTAGSLQFLELAAYDWHVRLRPTAAGPAPPVVLVTVTERDIQQLGTWPVPDGVLAGALEALVGAGARAIGLDIYRDVPVPPGHDELSLVLRRHPHIVAGMLVPQGRKPGVAPPRVLQGSERVGFADVIVDPGGTVRRALLLMDDGRNVSYSLALRLALLHFEAEGIAVQGDPRHPGHLRVGSTTLRPLEQNDGAYVRTDARGYQLLLDYRDPPDAFPVISFGDLLAGRFDPRVVENRIVLLGVTAESVKDSFYAPHAVAAGAMPTMHGVALHARIVSQLVRAGSAGQAPMAVPGEAAEGLWILLWTLLGGAAAFALRSAWRFALVMSAGVAFLAASAQGLFVLGWWIPVVPPVLGWLGAGALVTAYVSNRERRERASLMSLFSSYMSAPLAEAIWKERDQFASGGRPRPQRLTATILFSDVVDFTTVSERLEPQALMDWFYQFMTAVTPLVNDHGGVILRFLGDSIMAAFGAPVPRSAVEQIRQDAVNAVKCALATQERVAALNRRLEQLGLPLISMRIGILTGPVVAGSLGSAARLEYNLHGDTVNTASRLESFDKEGFAPDYFSAPCRIFVGESTKLLMGDEFHIELVGDFRLKGKVRPTRIYRVHGEGRAESSRIAASAAPS